MNVLARDERTKLRVCPKHGPLSVQANGDSPAARCRLCGARTGPVEYVRADTAQGAVEALRAIERILDGGPIRQEARERMIRKLVDAVLQPEGAP